MKLKDYKTRMVHDGKRNNREVKITCELCGQEAWARWQRVKKGQGRFCGLECYNKVQREEGKKTWGKENVKFHWDNNRQCWYAYWQDKIIGQQKSTTKARFLWEQEYGELLANQVVTYIDGNPENCELDNLKMMSRSEWNKIHLMGHVVSNETKNKLSKAHTGKVLSDDHKLKISNSLRSRWANGEFDSIHVGEYNYKWRGGVENVYPKEFNNELKEWIKERDRHKCRVCPESDGRLEVHHLDGDRTNNNQENLITLCTECHHRIHEGNKESDPVILAFRSMLKI